MKSIIEINNTLLEKLNSIRTFYMSSLIENELANNYLSNFSNSNITISSRYKDDDENFVFGQGGGSLNTKVNVNECIKMITKTNERTSILINLLTINLCSAFESFLLELFELYLRTSNEYINNSQKSIKLQDVFRYNNINDIKEDLIQKELIKYSFESIEKQLELIQSSFKTKFNFSSEIKIAKRTFLKRNCIVHNKGIVNKELYEYFTEEQKARNNISGILNTSEFEFSEEIYLFHLMGSRITTNLLINFESSL